MFIKICSSLWPKFFHLQPKPRQLEAPGPRPTIAWRAFLPRKKYLPPPPKKKPNSPWSHTLGPPGLPPLLGFSIKNRPPPPGLQAPPSPFPEQKKKVPKGSRWPVRGMDLPRKGNGRPFELPKMPFIATVPLTALIVGARADLLRDGQSSEKASRP